MRKIFIFFLFCSTVCKAQISNIDSVKMLITIGNADSIKIKALKNLASYYWERNPDSCIYYSQQLISLGRKIKNESAEAVGYTRIGRAYNNKSNFSAAMENLLIALRKFERLRDSSWIANSYNHLGNVNKNIGKTEVAIHYYKLCLALGEKINDLENQMIASMNLGAIYADKNNLDSALFFEQKAFQLNRQLNNELELDAIFYTLGYIYDKLGEKEVAKSYFNRSIAIAVKDRDLKPASLAYNGLAKLYMESSQPDSSVQFARQALLSAQQSLYVKSIFPAANLLAQAFEKRKQYDSAFFYQKISSAAKDSLSSSEKIRQVEAFNYNEELRQQELVAEKEKSAEERRVNLQFAAIGIGLITALLLFLALSRKIITSTRTIEIIGVIALLFVFEFINLLIHPFIGKLTHHSPLLMLLIMVCIAALLVPAHHHLEKWITHKLVEKNKKIRLAAAKRTISKLEGNS
jgi:tetratricopeptide (TPR) repeat protein